MPPGRGGQPTRIKDLPPHPGNVYLPFAKLIQLEKLSSLTYRSIAPAFAPGGPVGVGRSYGAHVYMQAAWAASQTLPHGKRFMIHNISGNFILAGNLNEPFVYTVRNIRDGRSYCTRSVDVRQKGEGTCFTCIVSFKTSEHEQIDSQDEVDIYQKYSSVLSGKRPTDFEEVPGMDLPFYWARRKATGINDKFPGLECRKVDMERYNRNRHPLDRRQLIFYRTMGEMEEEEMNMHLCAHLLASDRNSLYIVSNHFELGDYFTSMSSLSHTVIFHGSERGVKFGSMSTRGKGPMDGSDDGKGRWFCMEVSASRMSGGRAVYHCRLWNSEGEHIATAMQDGLIRYAVNPQKPTEEEIRVLESTRRKYKPRSRSEKL